MSSFGRSSTDVVFVALNRLAMLVSEILTAQNIVEALWTSSLTLYAQELLPSLTRSWASSALQSNDQGRQHYAGGWRAELHINTQPEDCYGLLATHPPMRSSCACERVYSLITLYGFC